MQPERPASERPQPAGVTIADYLRQITPRAWVTPTLTALIVAGFGVEVALGTSPVNPTGQQLLLAGANFGPSVAEGEWWRAPASLFLHAGLIHIAFNLWAFWNIGKFAERVFGNLPFLVIYLLSGIGGALASLAMHPLTICVGASGAIFGVYGAVLAFVLRKDNRSIFPASFLVQQRNSLLGFIGFNVVFGLSMPMVDISAHGGGLLTGMAAGALLARDLTRPKANALLRAAGALLLTVLLGITAFGVRRRLDAVPEIEAEKAASAALVHLKAHRLAEAIDLYTQAVDLHPDADWLSNRGLAYLWSDDLAKGQADLRESYALEATPRTLSLLCEADARLAKSPEELGAAEQRCTDAIAGDPKNASLLLLRATVRDASHKAALALEDASAAVALEPGSDVGRRVRLSVLAEERMKPEAAALAETDCAALLAAASPTAYDLRSCARVAKARQDLATARTRLDGCLAIAPSDAIALTLRAELNEQEGRTEDSLADYKRLTVAAPELELGWNNLAWLEVLTGDFASARVHADRAVAASPDSAESRGTRCFALVGLAAVAEARPDCERAVEIDPGSMPDRGMLAFIDRRYDDARRAWDTASADPVLARELAPWKARLPR